MDKARMDKIIDHSSNVISYLKEQTEKLLAIGELLVAQLELDHTVFTAGNGGSAAEAQHMAEELIGRYKSDRRSLPAISLTADSTILTCIGNDYGFEHVFSRQLESLGQPGDVLVLFSTSGDSMNLLKAAYTALKRGMFVVCLLGKEGGTLSYLPFPQSPPQIIIDSRVTERIQEAHQVILHLLLEMIEEEFADKKGK